MKSIFLSLLLFVGIQLNGQDTMVFQKLLDGHSGPVETVAFSPDGTLVASGGWDNVVRLYAFDSANFGTYLRTFTGHHGGITSVAINKDNRLLASGSKDNTVNLYDLKSGRILYTSHDHNKSVNHVAFDPSGRFLMTASSDKMFQLFDTDSLSIMNKKRVFFNYSAGLNDFVLSPSKGKIILASDNSNVDQVGMNGKSNKTFAGHVGKVNCIDISSDQLTMATGSDDKTIRLYNAKTGLFLRALEGHAWKVNSVKFSKDNRFLVSTCNNGEIKVWDVATGVAVSNLLSMGKNARQAEFSPDMKYIAVASLQNGPIYGAGIYKTPYSVFVKQKGGKGKNAKGTTPNAKVTPKTDKKPATAQAVTTAKANAASTSPKTTSPQKK